MLVSGCLGIDTLPCDAEGGHACGSTLEYAPKMCAFMHWSLILLVSSQCQVLYFFLTHSKTAHLFESIFTFHCHLEEKISANETDN